MSAPRPLGHIDAVCRVVAIDDELDRFGFTDATESNHPDHGEEAVTVVRLADGEVLFDIVAASQPRRILARALPRLARHLQRSATTRYVEVRECVL
jgi:uncharacterized protein (UPF0548 family)